MNVSAIDPTASALTQAAASANAPAKKAAPTAVPSQPSVATLSTPAAKVTISGVPATVKPEDRALYMQILKSVGGNVSLALAGLSAAEAKEAQS